MLPVLSTDAGDLEVETAGGGRLHCRTDHPLAAGDPVEIFVRPEHARVEPAATGGPTPNSLPARLVEVIELGALRRHSFMLAGDQQVDVDILADLAGAVSDAACAGFRLVLPADVTLAFPRDAT